MVELTKYQKPCVICEPCVYQRYEKMVELTKYQKPCVICSKEDGKSQREDDEAPFNLLVKTGSKLEELKLQSL